MTYWFAIVMGAALFTLMIPIVYRIWVGPTECAGPPGGKEGKNSLLGRGKGQSWQEFPEEKLGQEPGLGEVRLLS